MPDHMSEHDLMMLAEQHDKARGPFDPPCQCKVCDDAGRPADILAENAAYEKRVVAEGLRFDQVAHMIARALPESKPALLFGKPLESSARGREILTASHEGAA